MRHLVSGRKLNRTASHRKAMLSNLAVSILENERVTTTLAKAKEVRSVVERLITYGKKGNDLHAIRLAARRINNKTVLKKLFEDIAPSYQDREGGYTRIIKVGDRKGDNAAMSIIELVGRGAPDAVRKKKKKSKSKRVETPKAEEAPKAVQTPEAEKSPKAEETSKVEQTPKAEETPKAEGSSEEAASEGSEEQKS
ncbi:MAG: 50S ribosomal protein L17 [Chitinispirillaceae bacterium]